MLPHPFPGATHRQSGFKCAEGTRVGVGAGLFEQFPGRGGVHDERAEDFELWVGQQRAQGFGAARRGEGTTRLRTTGRSGEKLKL